MKMGHLEVGRGGGLNFISDTDRISEVAGICKSSNEPSGSFTCREIFD